MENRKVLIVGGGIAGLCTGVYTGNWRGSMEGWLYTPATGIRQLPCVLPGLENFYMVGQWIAPGGGLPAGLMTGKAVSKRIARDTGVRWVLN